jgi:hypothetical protein
MQLKVQSNHSVTLKDGQGKVKKTVTEVVKALQLMRIGTVIDVQNENIAQIDYGKRYYILFDYDYNVVKMYYVNVQKRLLKQYAEVGLQEEEKIYKLLQGVAGTLTILQAKEFKKAYTVSLVQERAIKIGHTVTITDEQALMAYVQSYKNVKGKYVGQTTFTINEAIRQIAYVLQNSTCDDKTHIIVRTEKGTVLLIV